MFERRLKIFLLVLLLGSIVLVLRAAQIQVLDYAAWRKDAASMTQQSTLVPTTRGVIYDRNGKKLAFDAPCVDVCVDFRAVTEEPDAQWVRNQAIRNLKDRGIKIVKSRDGALIDQECDRVRSDIAAMWDELGHMDEKGPDDITQTRRDIVARVEMREKYHFWHSYEQAAAASRRDSLPAWYRHFLSDIATDDGQDTIETPIDEETAPQVILHAVPTDVQARLARHEEWSFCLSLVPSKSREYPYGRAACHVVGYLAPVRPEETRAQDPNGPDELRKYWPADLIGRAGVEALCERRLRGACGRIEKAVGADDPQFTVFPVPGQDVKTSIDIDLQQDIEQEFIKPRKHTFSNGSFETRYNQHGAAVVLDIATGQVLALVSNPGYDPNMLDTQYAVLANDDLNRPLLDRATELAVEPGSTVKTIVGSGAITDGYMTPESTIQCKGELVIDGKPQPHNHCWTWALYKSGAIAQPSHELASRGDPELLPNDMLTISDGLKESCNVVFETIANKMGMSALTSWFARFGLGRLTGIGIAESAGRLYRPAENRRDIPELTWSAGIGEGVVHATPIQMANVAATIARNGIWLRPQLVPLQDVGSPDMNPNSLGPDRVDLHLSPAALAAVQKGMREVCTHYGSGREILPEEIERSSTDPPLAQDPLRGIPIAGKTGSAQTGQLMTIPVRGPDGQIMHDASGTPLYKKVQFGDPGTEGWYLPSNDPDPEKHLAHAWFIGYAPADHPQIAFCVLVEYGQSGGPVAGAIAHDLLVDCIRHGYLSRAK